MPYPSTPTLTTITCLATTHGPSFDGYLSSSSKDIHNPSMPYPSTPITTQQLCLATHTHSQTNNPLV
uniref:Uncharacterized protein n=1 Tax=Helianthus annuus TaxID=4232 RepID=A0A251SW05_HELAN